MKQFTLHLLSIASICFALTNCKHKCDYDSPSADCPQCTAEAQTIDEMMQWVYFKEGTFWIYEEATSGIRDTMSVFESESGESDGFRNFSYTMVSSLDGYNYNYWFNSSFCQNCLFDNVCRGYKVTCNKTKPGDVIGEGSTFLFPLKAGYKFASGCSNNSYDNFTQIIEFPVDIQPMSENFTHCVKYNIGCGPQSNWQPLNYYLCKKIGIVRKELLNSYETWNLVEYHIEP